MKNLKLSVDIAAAREILGSWPYNLSATNNNAWLVLETFDFGRDANGNTINRYHAYITNGDQVAVENNYTGILLDVLTSPHRREQSHRPGHIMARHWLDLMGYDLEYISFTQAANKKGVHTNFRTVYRIKNF